MQIFHFAAGNLKRKNNSQVSFVVLVAISVMLLVTGMVLMFYVPGYFDESNDRLNGPHYLIRIHDNDYEERFLSLLAEDERVKETEAVDCVMMDNANYRMGDGKIIVYANFMNSDSASPLFPFQPIYEDTAIADEEAVYVPLSFYQQGYRTGDEVSFEFKRKNYGFKIAGFFETSWFGSSATNVYNFFLRTSAYNALYDEVGGGKLLAARFFDEEYGNGAIMDFKEASGIIIDSYGRNAVTIESSREEMKSVSLILVNLMSMLAVLTSSVILAISLLVAWFRIANQIRDHMKQMGIMAAMGYTTGQIRASVVLEHFLTSLLGGIIGVGLSYGFLALLGKMISGFIGVRWLNPFHPALDIAGLVIILVIIAAVSCLASGKIRYLTPAAALREGGSSHSFKKNYFPLEKGSGSGSRLQARLAGKTIFHSPRQYLTMATILACVSFVLTFSVMVYKNMVLEENGFRSLLGMEVSDMTIHLAPHADAWEVRAELSNLDGVKSTSLFESYTTEVEGLLVTGYVCDNYMDLSTYSVYSGSLPIYDNEVVVTGVIADQMGKTIGDRVNVAVEGISGEYLICGLSQSLNNFGQQCAMTWDGMKRLQPSNQFSSVLVYLEDGVEYKDFLPILEENFKSLTGSLTLSGEEDQKARLKRVTEEKISNLLTLNGVDSAQYALMENGELLLSGSTKDYKIDNVEDTNTLVDTSMGVYMNMVRLLVLALVLLSAGVMALILHLMVKSSVIRRKKEFGIFKAVGYTSGQLMVQTAFCYLPISLVGITAGCMAGRYLTGSLMTALTYTMGVSQIHFTLQLPILFCLGMIIFCFVFLVAYVSAGRIRRVSVYELFAD